MDHAILKQQIVVIYLIMSIYTVYKSRIVTLPWCLAELTHPGLHNNKKGILHNTVQPTEYINPVLRTCDRSTPWLCTAVSSAAVSS